jgi:hypothetical protein
MRVLGEGPMNQVLERAIEVANTSELVKINQKSLNKYARSISSAETIHWMEDEKCPVNISRFSDEKKLRFVLVFNSISFSYWGNPKWTVERNGQTPNRGTWCLLSCLEQAIEQNTPLLESDYLKRVTDEDLKKIFEGDVEIPLLSQRTQILNELGGSIDDVDSILSIKDALEMVNSIIERYTSFNEAYKKRAQLLVSDLDYIFNLQLTRSDQLTACADYILPMVLRYYDILEYSQELAHKVDNLVELPESSQEEDEIRANTIFATNKISKICGIKQKDVNNILWLDGNNIPGEVEYHRTRTTSY